VKFKSGAKMEEEIKCCETCRFHYLSGTYNSPKCFPFKNNTCVYKTNSEFNKFRGN